LKLATNTTLIKKLDFRIFLFEDEEPPVQALHFNDDEGIKLLANVLKSNTGLEEIGIARIMMTKCWT
jgi:hypothetical protein